jgi:xanthine dehydrogenase YagT iron-sulfur-binding subunit
MSKRSGSDRTGGDSREKENNAQRLGRREFVKLVGTSGVAVSTVLAGEGLLQAAAPRPILDPQQPADAATSPLVGPGPVRMTLDINGAPQTLVAEPRLTLLDALRDRLYLTGAKKVCDRGTCGACTVIIDGKAMYSCTTLAIDVAQRPGAPATKITTIEGLAPEGELHPVSACWVDNDAQQCGFCTSGFVMAAKAYLDAHPQPAYEDVKAALGGNLCRCGTYMGIRHAVVDAGERISGGKA